MSKRKLRSSYEIVKVLCDWCHKFIDSRMASADEFYNMKIDQILEAITTEDGPDVDLFPPGQATRRELEEELCEVKNLLFLVGDRLQTTSSKNAAYPGKKLSEAAWLWVRRALDAERRMSKMADKKRQEVSANIECYPTADFRVWEWLRTVLHDEIEKLKAGGYDPDGLAALVAVYEKHERNLPEHPEDTEA